MSRDDAAGDNREENFSAGPRIPGRFDAGNISNAS